MLLLAVIRIEPMGFARVLEPVERLGKTWKGHKPLDGWVSRSPDPIKKLISESQGLCYETKSVLKDA